VERALETNIELILVGFSLFSVFQNLSPRKRDQHISIDHSFTLRHTWSIERQTICLISPDQLLCCCGQADQVSDAQKPSILSSKSSCKTRSAQEDSQQLSREPSPMRTLVGVLRSIYRARLTVQGTIGHVDHGKVGSYTSFPLTGLLADPYIFRLR
jgi:hypothetical protein